MSFCRRSEISLAPGEHERAQDCRKALNRFTLVFSISDGIDALCVLVCRRPLEFRILSILEMGNPASIRPSPESAFKFARGECMDSWV